MKLKVLFYFSCGMLAVSCAHHRDVRPGAEGVHTVILEASDEQEGARAAIKQANHYCDQYDKQAGFVKEDKKYKGDINEKAYKTAKKASKVIPTMGMGNAGAAVSTMLGDGYLIEMKFKCI